MTPSRAVTLSLLESRFRIESEDERMLDLVRLLWEPFLIEDAADAEELALVPRERGWRLHAPPDTDSAATDPWICAAVLRNTLSARAVRQARVAVPLHGAAAERDGTFLVLSAPPKAGKTTLLLELLARGWSLVTDDLVPLAPDGLTAAPFPKPVSVREPEAWRQAAAGWAVPAWLPPPTAVGLIPATEFPRPEVSEFAPSLLVFPRFEPGAASAAVPISAARTVAACAENLHPVAAATPRALTAVAGLGAAVSGHLITYASTEGALKLLGKCLACR